MARPLKSRPEKDQTENDHSKSQNNCSIHSSVEKDESEGESQGGYSSNLNLQERSNSKAPLSRLQKHSKQFKIELQGERRRQPSKRQARSINNSFQITDSPLKPALVGRVPPPPLMSKESKRYNITKGLNLSRQYKRSQISAANEKRAESEHSQERKSGEVEDTEDFSNNLKQLLMNKQSKAFSRIGKTNQSVDIGVQHRKNGDSIFVPPKKDNIKENDICLGAVASRGDVNNLINLKDSKAAFMKKRISLVGQVDENPKLTQSQLKREMMMFGDKIPDRPLYNSFIKDSQLYLKALHRKKVTITKKRVESHFTLTNLDPCM